MGYRNIKIETSQQLSIKNRQLFIGSSGEVQIPLEDINSILIESQAVTLSSYFLQKMAEMGIAVYVCDEKHLPNAVLLPMVRHSRHFKLLKCQMNLGKPKQKRLWHGKGCGRYAGLWCDRRSVGREYRRKKDRGYMFEMWKEI